LLSLQCVLRLFVQIIAADELARKLGGTASVLQSALARRNIAELQSAIQQATSSQYEVRL
jgi:hypothetical protein